MVISADSTHGCNNNNIFLELGPKNTDFTSGNLTELEFELKLMKITKHSTGKRDRFSSSKF